MRPPLFIFGCPRSGTTFLSSLLRASTYGAPFESHFIVKYSERLSSFEPLSEFRNFAALMSAILRERPIRQRCPQLDPSEVFSRVEEKSYRGLTHEICYHISRLNNDNARSWGDKTPSYTLEAETLIRLFPDAHYIYITRDGRDVALSLMRKPWGPENTYACARMWKQYIDKRATIERLLKSGNLLAVRYEDLLRDPENEIEAIYSYLGESCPPDVVAGLADSAKRGNYDKWKVEMSAADIEVFERVAGDSLRSEGYPVTHSQSGIGVLQAARFSTFDWLKRTHHLISQNTFDSFAIRFLGKEPFRD